MMKMKYWHELPQEEIDSIINNGTTVGEVLENYKQPDWCGYPEALKGIWGCWSLTDNRPEGNRTKISKDFCKECECFINASA